jgi:hypothetical protein
MDLLANSVTIAIACMRVSTVDEGRCPQIVLLFFKLQTPALLTAQVLAKMRMVMRLLFLSYRTAEQSLFVTRDC